MYKYENLLLFCLSVLSSAPLANSRPVLLEMDPEVSDAGTPKYIIHWPMDIQRAERQVVQPKWLDGKDLPQLTGDGKVHITEQNLAETAELRDAIQKAVQEGQYFVDIDQDDFSNQNSVQSHHERSLSQQSRQFSSTPLAPWNPSQWSMQFQQQQQPQFFSPTSFSSWNPAQWPMPSQQQQPQLFGPSQLAPWNPTQWSMPFQQQQHQPQPQPQLFGPSPWNPAQWPMQFELPTMAPPLFMGPQQPNAMQRMWNEFMDNTRRMFDL